MHNTSTTQVLLVLLFPLCFVAYGYAFFGSKWKLFLRYRLSHSNPNLSIFYMPKETRDNLHTQLYEPAAAEFRVQSLFQPEPAAADLVTGGRTDNDKNDMAPNAGHIPEENKA